MVAGLPVRVAFAGVGGPSGGDPLEFGGDRGQLFLAAGGVAFGFDGVGADDPPAVRHRVGAGVEVDFLDPQVVLRLDRGDRIRQPAQPVTRSWCPKGRADSAASMR
jgi:hypothetical protein